MKKSMRLGLFIALCLSMCLSVAFAAETIAETEPNDSFSGAQRIAVQTVVNGVLDSKKDVDSYRLELPESGCVRVAFEHEYVDTSSTLWAVTLMDGDNTELVTYEIPGSKTRFLSEPMGLPAGTCFVRVSDYYTSGKANTPYSLKLEYEPSDAWEKELNETFGKANRIALNKTVSGTIRTKDDRDYYRFDLEAPGAVSVVLNHEYLETGENRWQATLYSEDSVPLYTQGFVGKKTKNVCDPVGLPAGTYFLCMESYYKSTGALSDIPYQLTMDYTASDDWERELNDTFPSATRIRTNQTYSGTVKDKEDVDFYAFDLEDGPGCVTLSFSHEYLETSESRWKLTVYDGDNVEMVTWAVAGKGSKSTFMPIGLPGGRYYLRIESYYKSSGAFSSTPYAFCLTYAPDEEWEKEFNDTFSAANRLEAGAEVSGSVMHGKDADFYRVEIPKEGMYALSFRHEYIDTSENRWKVTVYNADNAEVTRLNVKGNETRTALETSLSAGTCYIKVENYYTGGSAASDVYQVTLIPQ